MTDVLRQPATVQRLEAEEIGWLTTVTAKGQPQSSPIWFLWDGSAFWLRSQAEATKVRNIGRNPLVSLHLSDDGHGGDVVTVDGVAELVDAPSAVLDRYVAKYADGIAGLGTTAEALAADYPQTIRITPTRTRAW